MKNKTIYLYDDGIGRVEYIQHMGTEKTIVNAARVSFGQDNDKELTERDHRLIKHLIGKKHTSTLEHNVITLKFTVPLFIRSQHHRHRTWSYNEISRRYTSENMQFYSPSSYRTQHRIDRQASNDDNINALVEVPGTIGSAPVSLHVGSHNYRCLHLYDSMIDAGIAREQARMVLPQNLYTEYYGTVNLNNLIKFLVLRLEPHAQWEIRQVAEACYTICEELWPYPMRLFREGFEK
jgi:thymidylate synthase (FAD)